MQDYESAFSTIFEIIAIRNKKDVGDQKIVLIFITITKFIKFKASLFIINSYHTAGME